MSGERTEQSDGQGELMSRREASHLAGVHYNIVRLWEQAGRVSVHRVTFRGHEEIRIPRSEILEVMKEREEEESSDPRLKIASLEAENHFLKERVREQAQRLREFHEELVQLAKSQHADR